MTNKPDNKSNITTIVISLAGSLLVAVGTIYTSLSNKEVGLADIDIQRMKIILEENDKMRQERNDLQIQVNTLSLRVNELELMNSRTLNEYDLLYTFTNNLPFSAWIKRYVSADNSFVMALLNEQYTADFGITKSDYVGKTDFDIHPPLLAQSYFDSDMSVLQSGRINVTLTEVQTKRGEIIELLVFKYPHQLPNNQQAVGGIGLSTELLKRYIN